VYFLAYEKSVTPCRDRSEWTRTNGPDVLPTYYEKEVGRPKRCRRKMPEENERGTKISKHGVKMHCSYCKSPNHTKRNCAEYKSDLENGIAFADPPKKKSSTTADHVSEEQAMPEADHVPEEQSMPTADRVPGEEPVPAADHVRGEEHVPAADHVRGEEHVPAASQEDVAANVGKRKRKPSRNKQEQEEAQKEYEARKKKAVLFDENGDIDDPTILTVIILLFSCANYASICFYQLLFYFLVIIAHHSQAFGAIT
jgi:hypothetical protein